MADVTPFLTTAAFQGMFGRTLDATETQLCGLLLQAAALWIIDPSRRPDLAGTDDVNAQLVSYEVTRDVLLPGTHRGQTQYSRQAGDRITSFSLAQAAAMLDFTPLHKQALGLSMVVAAKAYFDPPPPVSPLWNPAWNMGNYPAWANYPGGYSDPSGWNEPIG
jgi:hypothetical protein